MTAALKSKLEAKGPKKKTGDDDNQFLQVFSTFVRPMILRRTKKQVLTDLPPKIEKNVYLEFSEAELKQYETLKKAIQYSLVVEAENKNNSFKIIEGILRLRQMCLDSSLLTKNDSTNKLRLVGKPESRSSKLSSLIELLQDVISEGSKAIIFSQFSSFLEIIKTELTLEGMKTAYIDGQTKDREAQVNKFKLEKDCQVMLSTLKTGGVGLNLTEAEYVFIMDPWWNPAAENQAIDRAHRIGQSKSVMVYKLIMKDSIEEKVIELQNLKKNVANSVLELGEEGLLKTLSKDEIGSLFL
jgi:SNF2 family DNA or RNA helicase